MHVGCRKSHDSARCLRRGMLLSWVMFLSTLGTMASDTRTLAGTVIDPTGAVISGADLQLAGKGYTARQTTSSDGRFSFENVPITTGTLQVWAKGFAAASQNWAAPSQQLSIELRPALKIDQVNVSATRVPGRLADSASSVTVLPRADLVASGAITLDDTLRQIPGFSLFRRSGSLAANPTSQGISLRGTGASGASRALVLYDGVPLNDPFGGWVYWDRVPQVAIEDVEVLRGGASDLYGTAAMAGLINIMPRESSNNLLTAGTYFGNSRTPEGSFFWSQARKHTELTAYGEAFSTAGYYIVRPQDRGTVDTKAGQQHRVGSVAVEHKLSDAGRIFLRGSLFREQRDNGTQLQDNNTRLEEAVAGTDWGTANTGVFSVRAYADRVHYFQTFSTVSADRNTEALSRTQVVPAQRLGFSASWTRSAGRHTLVLGLDGQDIRGHSDEFVYAGGRPTTNEDNGGRQRFGAAFGEDIIQLGPKWLVTAAVRMDHWRNFDGFSRNTPLKTGISTFANRLERTQTAASPRVSVLRRVGNNWSVSASAYSAFRAPTLNELHRPFRLGNTITLANDALRAERLWGAETSIMGRVNRRVSMRGTFFWETVSDPIANVTLGSTTNLITQQRENLGQTRSRGVEFEADAQLNAKWTLSGGYQFADAAVVAAGALAGKQVAQVPRQQFSLQGRYSAPAGFTLALQGRYVGLQFEDDRNLLPLDPFFTADAFVSHRVNRYLNVFAAAENLFDQQYMVGRTPMITVGPPLLARLGVRLELGGR